MVSFEITAQRLTVTVDHAHCSEAVLLKCFYWYGRDFTVAFAAEGEATTVCLTPKNGELIATDAEVLQARVHNDLIDFQLRELIATETRAVRELLIAKAFAHYDTQQPPLTEVADPVGFAPDFQYV